MSKSVQLLTLITLIFGLAACQESGSQDVQAATDSPQAAAALFDSDMSKRGCEVLTAELVSATFDVPADALRQMKIAGCRYDWSNDEETLETGIMMLSVHNSEVAAASWFESATRNRSAEEMKAEMEQVSGRLEKSEQLDTELKKSTAKNMLSMIETKAINFEEVANLGDEARVSVDGTVYVRVNNLTFMVSAYKGPLAPPLDMAGVDFKQMAVVAKEGAAKWAIETAPQRKADGTRLARAIVDAL